VHGAAHARAPPPYHIQQRHACALAHTQRAHSHPAPFLVGTSSKNNQNKQRKQTNKQPKRSFTDTRVTEAPPSASCFVDYPGLVAADGARLRALLEDPAVTHIEIEGDIRFDEASWPPGDADKKDRGVNVTAGRNVSVVCFVMMTRAELGIAPFFFVPAHQNRRQPDQPTKSHLPSPNTTKQKQNTTPTKHHQKVEIRGCPARVGERYTVDFANLGQSVFVHGYLRWQGGLRLVNSLPSARRAFLYPLIGALSVEEDGVVAFEVCVVSWRWWC
jgi:hypothetical protein